MAPGKRLVFRENEQSLKKHKLSADNVISPGCQNLNPLEYCFIKKSEINGIELVGNSLIITFEPFECPLCLEDIESGYGVRLINCNHRFCRKCIVQQIKVAERHSEKVRCPFYSLCPEFLQEKEIINIKDSTNFDWTQEKIDTIIKKAEKNPFLRNEEEVISPLNRQPLQNSSLSLNEEKQPSKDQKAIDNTTLDKLEDEENYNFFECPLCSMYIGPGLGVALGRCRHSFCRSCLVKTIQDNDTVEIRCPFENCNSYLQDKEIKEIVSPDVYEKYLAKSLAFAKNNIKNIIHCSTDNCPMWCEYEDGLKDFNCPLCKKTTCIECKTCHAKPDDCKSALEARLSKEKEEGLTLQMLQDLFRKGKALQCPYCEAYILKNMNHGNSSNINCSNYVKGYCGWCKKKF